MITKFLDPRNDLAFKRIFGTPRNSDILIHFLNDILDLKEDPIQTVTFLKVNQDPVVAAERQSIVDVMCEDEKHNKFIIEMQLSRESGFIKRAQYYASKTYINQRDAGVAYKDLQNVRFLAIYDETLFSKKTEYLSYHEMRDIKTQENDLDSFKFVFLELSKFTNEIENLKTLTEKWAYFFKHATETSEEDLAKIVGGDLIIERAYKELDRFGWSKEELMEYEAVDMKIESVRDSMEGSFSDGENNKAREIVLNMHRMGMDIDTISKATSLTCEAVKNIIKEKEEENPEDE
ncbi:MAG TPA: Rpn family recombination-promoting nuclease/putative transposase [Alphaproteobacteria bacterium]|nr:Rpn family recombination-promoting nuclease/putative transposase [Alphaproteobacteria bacterium]